MLRKVPIEETLRFLTEEIARRDGDVAANFPFEKYCNYLKNFKTYLGFQRNPRSKHKEKTWFENLSASYRSSILRSYNRLSLASLVKKSLDILPDLNFPKDILNLYWEWFARVHKDFNTLPEDYYDLDREEFIVDLGVCCLRSIPIGGAWIVQKSRVGLGPLIGGGPWQSISYLSFIMLKGGGFSPYWVIHTAIRYFPRFREEEMNRAYHRIAQLMKWDSTVKGIYRGGWLLDPQLKHISPNLAYLREVPENNGAHLFRSHTIQPDIKWALYGSSLRRRLFAEGKYRPKTHAYLWPAKEFLNWVDDQNSKSPPVL